MKFIIRYFLPAFLFTFVFVSALLLVSSSNYHLIMKAHNLKNSFLLILYGSGWIISVAVLTGIFFGTFFSFRRLKIVSKEYEAPFKIALFYFLKYLLLIAIVFSVVSFYFNLSVLPKLYHKYRLLNKAIVTKNSEVGSNNKDFKLIDLPREMTFSVLQTSIKISKQRLSNKKYQKISRYIQRKIRMYNAEIMKRIVFSFSFVIFVLLGATLGVTLQKELKKTVPILTAIVIFYIFPLSYLEKLIIFQNFSHFLLFLPAIIILIISFILWSINFKDKFSTNIELVA